MGRLTTTKEEQETLKSAILPTELTTSEPNTQTTSKGGSRDQKTDQQLGHQTPADRTTTSQPPCM